jgi:hypothetical protein
MDIDNQLVQYVNVLLRNNLTSLEMKLINFCWVPTLLPLEQTCGTFGIDLTTLIKERKASS